MGRAGEDIDGLVAVYSYHTNRKTPSSVNALREKIDGLVGQIAGMAKLIEEADTVLEENYSAWTGAKEKAELKARHAELLTELEYINAKNAMRGIRAANEFLREVGALDSNDEFGMKVYFDSSSQRLNGLYEKVYRLMGAVHTARAVLHYSEPIEGLAVGPISGWK